MPGIDSRSLISSQRRTATSHAQHLGLQLWDVDVDVDWDVVVVVVVDMELLGACLKLQALNSMSCSCVVMAMFVYCLFNVVFLFWHLFSYKCFSKFVKLHVRSNDK